MLQCGRLDFPMQREPLCRAVPSQLRLQHALAVSNLIIGARDGMARVATRPSVKSRADATEV